MPSPDLCNHFLIPMNQGVTLEYPIRCATARRLQATHAMLFLVAASSRMIRRHGI